MDFAVHLLPSAALLAVIVLAWRREWLAGVAFIALALGYAYWARDHAAWIAAISGPLLVVGILFLGSWTHQRRADP
jgi:hypothetical protein